MKKIIIISAIIFLITFLMVFLIINSKENKKDIENNNISIILETEEGNIESNTFPDKDFYEYSNIACENTNDEVTVSFNNDTWKLNLSVEEESIDGNFNCVIYFKHTPRIASEFITSKYTENNNEGLIKLEQPSTDQTPALTEYRYSGSEVNNYVLFNDELWRIIGVFSVDDGTGNYEQRVKIIREESIGRYSFDSTPSGINDFTESTGEVTHYGGGSNQWGNSADYEGSDLMRLLNPGYENENVNNSLYWNRVSGTCYNGDNNATTTCDFTSTGLTSEATDMIGDAKWYLGAKPYDTTTMEAYSLERGSNLPRDDTGREITKTLSWVGKVAVPYPSDYGFASSECYSDISLSNYNLEKCLNSNYLSNNLQWRLISPRNDNSFSTNMVSFVGANNGHYAARAYGIRPTLYLKQNVKIAFGTGAVSNPYILTF